MKLFKVISATVALVLAALVVGEAQITIPNTFTSGTTIQSAQVNANFTTLGSNALNRTGGTMTGTLTSNAITPSATNSYDLGSSAAKWKDFYLAGNETIGGTSTVTGATTHTGASTFSSTVAINGITYTWPASQTANYFLQTNGSGTLSWALAGNPTVTATKVATYTAAINEFVVANGTFTVNLPASSGNTGKFIDVKNIGTGTITVDGNSAETIDGAATYDLPTQYQSVTLISDGTNWYIR